MHIVASLDAIALFTFCWTPTSGFRDETSVKSDTLNDLHQYAFLRKSLLVAHAMSQNCEKWTASDSAFCIQAIHDRDQQGHREGGPRPPFVGDTWLGGRV